MSYSRGKHLQGAPYVDRAESCVGMGRGKQEMERDVKEEVEGEGRRREERREGDQEAGVREGAEGGMV